MNALGVTHQAPQAQNTRPYGRNATDGKQNAAPKAKTSGSGVRTIPGHLSKPAAFDRARTPTGNSAKANVPAKAESRIPRPRIVNRAALVNREPSLPPPPKAKGEASAAGARSLSPVAKAKASRDSLIPRLDLHSYDYRGSSISALNSFEDELDGASELLLDTIPHQRSSVIGGAFEDRWRWQEGDGHKPASIQERIDEQLETALTSSLRRASFPSDAGSDSHESTSSHASEMKTQPMPHAPQEQLQNDRRRTSFFSDDEDDASAAMQPAGSTTSTPMQPMRSEMSIIVTPPPEDEAGSKLPKNETAISRLLKEKDDAKTDASSKLAKHGDKSNAIEVSLPDSKCSTNSKKAFVARGDGYVHETLLLAQLAEIKNHQTSVQKLLQVEKQRHLEEIAAWEKRAVELADSLEEEPALAKEATEAREKKYSCRVESCEKEWQCQVAALRVELASLQLQRQKRLDAVNQEDVTKYLRSVYQRSIMRAVKRSMARKDLLHPVCSTTNSKKLGALATRSGVSQEHVAPTRCTWEPSLRPIIGTNYAKPHVLLDPRAQGWVSPSVSTRSCSPALERSFGAFPSSPVPSDTRKVPLAVAVIDTNGDGHANMYYVGADRNRDGIPDALQTQVPLAVAGIDTNRDGLADLYYVGADRNRDGIPDALQTQVPLAVAGIDTNRDGHANLYYVGADRNRDGIPDALQTKVLSIPSSPVLSPMASPRAPVLLRNPSHDVSVTQSHAVAQVRPASPRTPSLSPRSRMAIVRPASPGTCSLSPRSRAVINQAPVLPLSRPISPGPTSQTTVRRLHSAPVTRAASPSQTPSIDQGSQRSAIIASSSSSSSSKAVPWLNAAIGTSTPPSPRIVPHRRCFLSKKEVLWQASPVPSASSTAKPRSESPLQSANTASAPALARFGAEQRTTTPRQAMRPPPRRSVTPTRRSSELSHLLLDDQSSQMPAQTRSTPQPTAPRSGAAQMPATTVGQKVFRSVPLVHYARDPKCNPSYFDPAVSSKPSATPRGSPQRNPMAISRLTSAVDDAADMTGGAGSVILRCANAPQERRAVFPVLASPGFGGHVSFDLYAEIVENAFSEPPKPEDIEIDSVSASSSRDRYEEIVKNAFGTPVEVPSTGTTHDYHFPSAETVYRVGEDTYETAAAATSNSHLPSAETVFVRPSRSVVPSPSRSVLPSAETVYRADVCTGDTSGQPTRSLVPSPSRPVLPSAETVYRVDVCRGDTSVRPSRAVDPSLSRSVPPSAMYAYDSSGRANNSPIRSSEGTHQVLPDSREVVPGADDRRLPSYNNQDMYAEIRKSAELMKQEILASVSTPYEPSPCDPRCLGAETLLADALRDQRTYDALVDAVVVCHENVAGLEPHSMRRLGSAEERLRGWLDHELRLAYGLPADSWQDWWPTLRKMLLYCMRLRMTDLESFRRASAQAAKLQLDPLSFVDPALMSHFQHFFVYTRMSKSPDALLVERVIQLEPGLCHARYALRRGVLVRDCENISPVRVISQNIQWATPLGHSKEPLNSEYNECYLFYSASPERIGENARDLFNDFNNFGHHIHLAEYASHACQLAAGTGRHCAFSKGRRAIVVCRAFCGQIKDAGRCSPTESLLAELREPRRSQVGTKNSEHGPFHSIMCTPPSENSADREFVLPIDQVLPEFIVFCSYDFSARQSTIEQPHVSSLRTSNLVENRSPSMVTNLCSSPPALSPVTSARQSTIEPHAVNERTSNLVENRAPSVMTTICPSPPTLSPVTSARQSSIEPHVATVRTSNVVENRAPSVVANICPSPRTLSPVTSARQSSIEPHAGSVRTSNVVENRAPSVVTNICPSPRTLSPVTSARQSSIEPHAGSVRTSNVVENRAPSVVTNICPSPRTLSLVTSARQSSIEPHAGSVRTSNVVENRAPSVVANICPSPPALSPVTSARQSTIEPHAGGLRTSSFVESRPPSTGPTTRSPPATSHVVCSLGTSSPVGSRPPSLVPSKSALAGSQGRRNFQSEPGLAAWSMASSGFRTNEIRASR